MTRVLAKTSILTLEVRNQHKVLEGKIMEIEDKSLKNKEWEIEDKSLKNKE